MHWGKHQELIFQDGWAFKSRLTVATTIYRRRASAFSYSTNTITVWLAAFYCRSGWRLRLLGATTTYKPMNRLTQVENKVLAVVWCLGKARLFVLVGQTWGF